MDTYTRELMAELKALREEVAELRPPAITKEEILSVKDRKAGACGFPRVPCPFSELFEDVMVSEL